MSVNVTVDVAQQEYSNNKCYTLAYIYIYIYRYFWDVRQHNDVGLFVLDGNVFIKIKNTTTLFDNEMMSLNNFFFFFEKQTQPKCKDLCIFFEDLEVKRIDYALFAMCRKISTNQTIVYF